MTIEPLTPDDWQTLRDLRLRALLTDPDSFGSTWDDEQDGDEPWWRTWLAEQRWFVARDDAGDPVGMVVAVPPKGGEPFTLNGLWVAPQARGSGRARALARRVVDEAAEAGDAGVVLTVVDGNTAARNLFTGMGFRPTGERYPRERDPSRWNERLALPPQVTPEASPRPGSPPR